MKFISWNVNGIRSCMSKGFNEYFNMMNADIFAVQETKMQEGQKDITIDGYYCYMNSAIKKGYSGTLVYTKEKPLKVKYGIDGMHNDEGRVITLEYDKFYFITVYSPNSKENLARIDYRMIFDDDLREYLIKLSHSKSVILCGDLNVAHMPIDLKNPDANTQNPGYSIEERTKFSKLLDTGFIDTFRYLHKDEQVFSWWSYRFNSRSKNIGWRIDYFITSQDLKNRLIDSYIMTKITGSDHAPVVLEIEM